uniref:Chromo domain-containing protein n=1 Tax=Leptobrachium leishanense TaxID=445787 RepID=A0A8C5P883_9ANUR
RPNPNSSSLIIATVCPSYVPGQRVWLSTQHIKLRVPSHKLAPRFIGPYRVLQCINPVCYALELPKYLRIPNSFHTSLLKPLVCIRYSAPVKQPPPVLVQAQEEYEVQALINSRWSRGGLQYLVHWKGYSLEERSWVAASDVHAPGLVSAYHCRFPSRPRARRQGGGAVTVAHVQGSVAPSTHVQGSVAPSAHVQGLCLQPMAREVLRLRPMAIEVLRLRPMSREVLRLRPMSREVLRLQPISREMLRSSQQLISRKPCSGVLCTTGQRMVLPTNQTQHAGRTTNCST